MLQHNRGLGYTYRRFVERGCELDQAFGTHFFPTKWVIDGLVYTLRTLTPASGARLDVLRHGRAQVWALSVSRPRSYSMFTARAARSAIVAKDMDDCTIIRVLAQRESTGTSVGEKAVLVLKARNR